MSTCSPVPDADITSHEAFFERVADMSCRLFGQTKRRADTSDAWALYKRSRGVASVSPAVERRLVDAAARQVDSAPEGPELGQALELLRTQCRPRGCRHG